MVQAASTPAAAYPRNQKAPWRGLGVYMARVGALIPPDRPMSFAEVVKAHKDTGYCAYGEEQMAKTMERLTARGISEGSIEAGWTRGENWAEAADWNRWRR